MPAIFTDQWKREQEMELQRKKVEAERKVHAAQVKHTVTVYAWSENGSPATVQEFQEGLFTWPFFPISSTILSELSLNRSDDVRVQLYRKALTWVNISTGHVVEVQEGARIFLKLSNIVDYPDFDALLCPTYEKSGPHLRTNLAQEVHDLCSRTRIAMERRGKEVERGSSDEYQDVMPLPSS